MNAFIPIKRLFPVRTLAAAVFGCVCTTALADGMVERVSQRGKLFIGIGYVAPPYVAGAKFRTPEALDLVLAEDIGKRLQTAPNTLRIDSVNREQSLAAGKADIVLTAIPEADPLRRSTLIVPTGYAAGPMAIMRSDTNIKTWEQLKGRTVCLSEGGLYVGAMAARYGAIEKIFKAPADSLLTLRTGGCDAAVHDDTMLEELIKLPEWKKFSARLPVGPRTSLALAVPAGDTNATAFLKQVARDWQATGYLDSQMKKMVRNIAFEVYLDQNVPDCH
jgi:polar amino acid transport system substrate-binding protein